MYKTTTKKWGQSFLGSYIFQQLVPENHPLRILSKIADFNYLNEDLKHLYSQKGQRAYSPAMMTRILILKDLYNISDERVIQMVKENIPARMYAGISLESSVPDASDLTYFRRRLGEDNFQKIFDKTIEIAGQNGLQIGDILLIDSTHTQAKVNRWTQGHTKDKNHDDKDAVRGYKSATKPFFGYKHHTSVENKNNLIISVQTTLGNVYDGSKLKDLVEESLEKIPIPKIVSADKGYDDQDNHFYLEDQEIFSAICLKDTRLQTKKKKFKDHFGLNQIDQKYFDQYMHPYYQEGQEQRYKVEQSYAEMKNYHGLRRSKYLGLEKTHIQACLTATVYNLKHILTDIALNLTKRKLNNSFVT